MAQNMQKGGIIQLALIIILIIIVLSLLGVSISSIVNDKTVRENFEFVWEGVVWLWDVYVKDAAVKIWNILKEDIFIPLKEKLF